MKAPPLPERPPAGPERAFYKRCLAASAGLHALLLIAGRGLPPMRVPPPTMEIDLTSPFPGDGPAKLGRPKPKVPDAPAAPPKPAQPDEVLPPVPQRTPEWALPGPETRKVQPQAPLPTPGGAEGGTGTSPLDGGVGDGADYGSKHGLGTGGSPPIERPKLLNLDEVLRNLRRFYPESERRAGREGAVRVNIHIGSDGSITGVDVAASGGAAFDEAAEKVARLMRFAPARSQAGPVAVVIGQDMVFRLTDED